MITKKIILLIVSILVITGCDSRIDNQEKKYIQDNVGYSVVIDKETCVEYIEFVGYYKKALSVRLNADGKPIVNEKCLNDGR